MVAFNIMREQYREQERFVREVLTIKVRCSRRPQKACNLLSERCECFSLYSSKVNKVSLPSPVKVHTICLIGKTALNCVLTFSTLKYLIFSSDHC